MFYVEPIKCQFCTANQLTGFYMRATLALIELMKIRRFD